MADVKLSFQVDAKQLQAAFRNLENLNKTVKKINKNAVHFNAQTEGMNSSLNGVTNNTKKTNESLDQLNKTTQNVASTITKNNILLAAISASLLEVSKNFAISSKGAQAFEGLLKRLAKTGFKLDKELIQVISRLKDVFIGSIGDILKAVLKLASSRNIFQFGFNLIKLNKQLKESYGDLTVEILGSVERITGVDLEVQDLSRTIISAIVTMVKFKAAFSVIALVALNQQKALNALAIGTVFLQDKFIKLFPALGKTNTAFRRLTDTIIASGSNTKSFSTFFKSLPGVFRASNSGFNSAASAAQNFQSVFGSVGVTLGDIKNGLRNFGNNLNQTKTVLGRMVDASVKFDKTLFGVVQNTGLAGGALVALGSIMSESDSAFTRLAGKVLFFTGIVLGGSSVAVTILINKFAGLIKSAGDAAVAIAVKATAAFIEADKKAFILQRTIDGFRGVFGGSIGSAESWTQTIEELGARTGETTNKLNAIVNEVVSVTSQMGFSEEQMKKLINIAVDYAAQIGGDSLQATLDFIGALNGNSQSVIKYGVKLGEASVAQKVFGKNSKVNFRSLSDSSKVQARFSALLKQYEPIAGVAADVTETLAGQAKVYENNLKNVNVQLGKGAQIIENNNLLYFVFNRLISLVSDNVLAFVGFMTSLIGRLLQATGLFLGLSFTIIGVIKTVKLLNILLASDIFGKLIAAEIPLLGISFQQLASTLLGTKVQLTSIRGIFRTTVGALIFQSKLLIASFLNLEVQSLTLAGVMKGALVKSIKLTTSAVKGLTRALLRLLANPIVLAILAIAAALFALFKAFEFIEKQTKVFSDTMKVFTSSMSALEPVLRILGPLFDKLRKTIITLASKAFGVFIHNIAKALSVMFSLAALLEKTGVISKETADRFRTSSKRLDALANRLRDAGFDVRKFNDELNRTPSSKGINIKINIDDQEIENLKRRLEITLRGVSSPFERAQQDFKKNLQVINDSVKSGLITEERALEARKKLNLKFQRDVQNITASGFGNAVTGLRQVLANPPSFKDLKKGTGTSGALLGVVEFAAGAIAQGAEGARKLITDGLAFAIDSVIPGLGQALKPLIDLATQGPEVARKTIQEFFAAIPKIIQNVVEAAPVIAFEIIKGLTTLPVALLEGIIKGLPGFFTALVEGFVLFIPEIVLSIIDSLIAIVDVLLDLFDEFLIRLIESVADKAVIIVQRIAEKIPILIRKIIQLLPQIITAFISLLPRITIAIITKELPKITAAIIKEIPNIAKQVGKAIAEEFKKALDKITAGVRGLFSGKSGGGGLLGGISRVGGSIGGAIGGIGKKLGFADGGIVPGGPPFTDRVDARLTPGELVIPRTGVNSVEDFVDATRDQQRATAEMMARLEALLASDTKGSKDLTVNVQIGQDQLAQALLNLSRQGFRLSG